MTTEIAKIDPKEYGLEEKQAAEVQAAFMPKIVERDNIKPIYEGILTSEITPALCKDAKDLRLKLVKVRTGIAEIHKTQKAFYLAAGRYVDAWKNKETTPVLQMEETLMEIEEHYSRIEAQKIAELQNYRAAEIAKYSEESAFIPGNLGELLPEVYNNYLLGVKTAYDTKKENERIARIAEEKRINEERIEQQRIRLENERMKKEMAEREAKAEQEKKEREQKEKTEREAHEKALKIERDERERVQRELEAKAEQERKAKAEADAKIEAELNKGDADKVIDLITELSALRTKYSFKSKKNKQMYDGVGQLCTKIINYINDYK